MKDPIKQAEARGYAKGYAAGQRRTDREDREAEAGGRYERFRQDAFLAILPVLIQKGTWGLEVDGVHKNWNSMKEYSEGAWQFADQAVKGTTFR